MTAPSTRLDALRAKYVSRWTTRAFKIVHGEYFANHLLHGIVALSDLGASETQIDAFAKQYASKLIPADGRGDINQECNDVEKVATPVAMISWAEATSLLGKKQNFDALRELYEAEVAKLGVDGAVKTHLPMLSGGLGGRLLHGLIQLGYAYYLGGALPVAEGLASMHFSYLPFVDESHEEEQTTQSSEPIAQRAFTKEAILTLTQRVCCQEDLLAELYTHLETPAIRAAPQSILLRRAMAFSSDPVVGNRVLFQAVAPLTNEFDPRDMNGWVALDFALWLYASLPQNNFAVLHIVTSAWSLQQMEHLLTPVDRAYAWKTWLQVTLSLYIALELAPLQDIEDDDTVAIQLEELPEWTSLVDMVLKQSDVLNEHVFKLVQVAHVHAEAMKMPSDLEHGDSAVSGSGSGSGSSSSFLTRTQREYVAKKAALKATTEESVMLGRATAP